MSIEHHRLAEDLMWRGDRALADGQTRVAEEFYLAAAEAEAMAFQLTPSDKPNTRGVLGLSSVALFRRAGMGDRAKQQAYVVLASDGVAADSMVELELILDEVRTERLAGLYPDAQGMQWSLRGGRIGFGVARSETVTLKIDQVQRLAWRVFEMLAGRELRTSQPAPQDVRNAVDLLVTQPTAGSFTFGVRLAEHQLTLDEVEVDASLITRQIYSVVKAAEDEEESPLLHLVPDQSYRDLLLRLVRNIAPDGREVGEIEVREIGVGGPPTILRPEVRARISRRLPIRPTVSSDEIVELRDVLRVIDLNRRKIALGTADREQPCEVPADLALVDLIEGLEDKPVRVTGHWRGRVFVVHEVEPDYGDET